MNGLNGFWRRSLALCGLRVTSSVLAATSSPRLDLAFEDRIVVELVCDVRSSPQSWEIERKSQEDAARETARSAEGLVWTRTLTLLADSVFEPGHGLREGDNIVTVTTKGGDREKAARTDIHVVP